MADGGHDVVILGHSSDRRAWSSQVGAGVFIRNVGRPWIPLVRRNKGARANSRFGRILVRATRVIEKGFLYLNFAVRALMHLLRERPNVIHSHDLNTLPVGVMGKWLTRAQLIYDSHELWVDQNPFVRPHPVQMRLVRLVEGLLLKSTDAVITVSESIADELGRMYGISRPSVVRNCKFPPIAEEGSLRNRLNLSGDSFLAIYTGLITGGRGVEDFLEVMTSFPKLNFCLMGPATESFLQNLRFRADHLGLASRLHILPAVKPEDVPSSMAGADFAFVPAKNTCRSYYLSLSNKFFEAVAAGLPLLTSNFPEFQFLVEEYQLGETYSPADLETLKATLGRMMNRDKLKVYSENSKRAAGDLNWPREKLKLLSLYNQMPSRSLKVRALART